MHGHNRCAVPVQVFPNASFAHAEVVRVHLYTDAVPTPEASCHSRCPGAHEGIQHSVTNKAEHPDQALGQLEWIWRGMEPGRSPGHAGPDLLKPLLIAIRRDDTQYSSRNRWAAVAATLALHQDEFNIVLNDGVGFVGFTQETASVPFCLILGVSDLMPDDRRKVRETDGAAVLLDGCM